MQMPTYDQLMIPTLKALEELGGSGGINEIAEKVIQLLELPEEISSTPHNAENSSETEVEYRLAWARTYLKKYGLINNSTRGIWSFTNKYHPGDNLDPEEIKRYVKQEVSNKKAVPASDTKKIDDEILLSIEEELEPTWKEILHQELLQMDPSAFERLTMRLLRENGFIQLEVTGKTGDGGIDGKGIIKLQNVLSYHVVFQCKRYKGGVSSSTVRDFRGAMVGRADKGLIITTGSFTRDAIKEATRDGASPIDLIDGDNLIEMLKELRLGVKVRMVEETEVDKDWFKGI